MITDIKENFVAEKAADYAILSDLAYLNWVNVGGKWIIAQNQPNRPKQYDYYKDKWQEMQSKGYGVMDFAPNDESGFSAVIFEKDGIQILAIRGTEFKPSVEKWKDFSADAYIHLGYMPPGQFESLVQYISDKGMYGCDITGHSLGGFLAKVAKTLFPNSIGEVYTYNAPWAKELTVYTSDGTADENGKVTIQFTISTPMESTYTYSFKWDLATWYAYRLFLTNKDFVEGNIHNIGGKDLLSSLAGLYIDVIREACTASTNYSIAPAINDLQKHQYHIDPRKPVSFIGSKENENIEGSYGNDTLSGKRREERKNI